MGLKILIIGTGAREHALRDSIKGSPLVERVRVAPGNGGTLARYRHKANMTDIDAIVELAVKSRDELVVVGPEAPLCAGLVDKLEAAGILAFGPSKLAAQLEGSKIFAMQLCADIGVPTPRFEVATTYQEAARIIARTGFWVIKLDGLAAGKGVVVAHSKEHALATAKDFLAGGGPVLMQERLQGPECSVMGFCDGERVVLLPPSRDYKRVGEGDTGLNTGGMGAYAPLPDVDAKMLEHIKRTFFIPILAAMKKRGMPFRSLLYAGLMLTVEGPKLLEFNVRFGDPETQAVLPLVKSDIVPYLLGAAKKRGLADMPELDVHPGAGVCTVVASEGYPVEPRTGQLIRVLPPMRDGEFVFHAGTERRDGRLITTGGRVLSCVAHAATHEEARARSQHMAKAVDFSGAFFRKDIALGVGT